MTTRIFFFFGILLVLVAIAMRVKALQEATRASQRDDHKTVYGSVAGDVIPCSWEVQPPERVMSENRSQGIVIEVSGFDEEPCESVISFRAPGFDASPMKEEQTIALGKNKNGSISWILTPRKSGMYEIAVSDTINTKIFGITVTNIFGLSAFQAKVVSVLGGLFGPMLTVPWWWDKWRQRRNKNIG